jgi:DNA invertase Pin-like site-specific DNA recombinase
MSRVVAYCRVSRDEQGLDGLGIAAQKATIEAEIQRRSWELVEVIEEIASGGKIDRPGLLQAVEMIRTGQADALIVSKLDRLSRSVAHFSALLERFRSAGWGLVVLDLGVDTTTIAGEAMANVMATFAQMERRRIGERTKEALSAARARGTRLGRPPVLPDQLRRRLVRMRRKGLTYRMIAEKLNDEGVATAHGGARWHPETVRKIAGGAGST